MKIEREYDTLVIGTGPAGEGAAMSLSKGGQSVAAIEAHDEIGGGCTHWGTIPSKALRHSIQLVAELNHNPMLQQITKPIKPSYPDLLESALSVVSQRVGTHDRNYYRNNIDVIHGWARFEDANTIAVSHENTMRYFCAKNIVLATGSRPYHPPDVDFSHPRILDSDSILQYNHSLNSIMIYGAGVIGCEYASIFSNLDIKTDLINTRDRLLSFLDDEITDALSYHLRSQGIVIRHNEEYDSVEMCDDGVIMHCKSGKKFKADVLLWANGRSGNTRNMGLEEIGVKVNHRGQLDVNEHFQTELPHVFAAGDVIGSPGLASASYDQGRYVGDLIVTGEPSARLVDDIPTGIYTSPEISSVGKTEKELTDEKVPYEVGRASFNTLARGQITGRNVGMLKLLFHRETLELLGIHCFGAQASEIVHIGQAIMSQPAGANTMKYFTETTFNYPTMAEAYRVAALNGLNRVF